MWSTQEKRNNSGYALRERERGRQWVWCERYHLQLEFYHLSCWSRVFISSFTFILVCTRSIFSCRLFFSFYFNISDTHLLKINDTVFIWMSALFPCHIVFSKDKFFFFSLIHMCWLFLPMVISLHKLKVIIFYYSVMINWISYLKSHSCTNMLNACRLKLLLVKCGF